MEFSCNDNCYCNLISDWNSALAIVINFEEDDHLVMLDDSSNCNF